MTIHDYKKKFNIQDMKSRSNLVEVVHHKCFICGDVFLLDSDNVAGHLKGKHNGSISHAVCNKKYMITNKKVMA